MGNYEQLKQAVSDVIKTNGNQEITGQILQNALLTIISTIGVYATFVDVADLNTNPGTPDQNSFYIASKSGIYPNFGVSLNNEIAIILNKNGSWIKKTLFNIDDSLNENSKNPVENKAISIKIKDLETQVAEQKNEVEAAKEEAIQAIEENEQEAILNFNSQRVTPDMLSESTLQLIQSSGGGSITNLADEEDITSKENDLGINVLKFADRRFDEQNYSGYGYKILRKNILQNKNVLTQYEFNQENTIYVIKYKFDLNNQNIILPTNCIIKFDGGNISNGIFTCNKTLFINLYDNCFDNIKFYGTIENNCVYPSWFGIFPVMKKEEVINQQNKFDLLSSFIRCQTESIITFESGFYGFGGEGDKQEGWIGNPNYSSYRYYAICISGENINNITIKGNNAYFINTIKCHYGAWERNGNEYTKVDDDGTLKYMTSAGGFIFIRPTNPLKNLEIYNIISDYTKERYYGGWATASPTQSAIEINASVDNLIIKNCSMYNNMTDGISNVGHKCGNVLIQFCDISNSGRSGISLDTADNIVVDHCNIAYSGDWDFDLIGYRFEVPGAAINSEPTIEHTKNLTITNCDFFGCAYTYISLGYTLQKANENVIINNVTATSFRTSYTITSNKENQIQILENCPSFVNGNIVKSLRINNVNIINTMFKLDSLYVTNRFDDISSDEISITANNINILTNNDLKILTSSQYPISRFLTITNFDTAFRSDNINVNKENKVYSIQIYNVNIELVSKFFFKTNIHGDKKLNVYNINVYIIENRTYGVCLNSNIFSQTDYITNISNIKLINNTTLSQTTSDSFLYRAAKHIEIINDYDKNSNYKICTIPINRDINLARINNSDSWGSYTINANFIKLSTDDSKERFFGIVGNNPTLLSELLDDSIVINDLTRTLYNDVLFSSVKNGSFNYFYGVKKGLPYNTISSLDLGEFTPLIGECVYYTQIKKPIWWDGAKWINANGEPIV